MELPDYFLHFNSAASDQTPANPALNVRAVLALI
jgi:hypothetical protein